MNFSAEPKVVSNKPKFRSVENNSIESNVNSNIMIDKRVYRGNTHNAFLLKKQSTENPISENKPLRKKGINKITPYDIRPSPPKRMKVELDQYLIDQDEDKIVNTCIIDTQTDEFKERPDTPEYIQFKTGVDCETQIWDKDLFDFNNEVIPILNVLADKTVEQSLLEVEEEEELDNMKKYKIRADERKRKEEEEQNRLLRKELNELQANDERLRKEKVRVYSKTDLLSKVQSLHIAKNQMTKLQQFALNEFQQEGQFNNNLNIGINNVVIEEITNKTYEYKTSKEAYNDIIDDILVNNLDILNKAKTPLIKNRKLELEKESKRDQNKINQPNKRIVNVLFKSPFEQSSVFKQKFNKLLDKTFDPNNPNSNEYSPIKPELLQQEDLDRIDDTDDTSIYPEFDEYYREFSTNTGDKDQNEIPIDSINNFEIEICHHPRTPCSMPRLEPIILIFNESGEIIDGIDWNRKSKSIKYQKDLFNVSDVIKNINQINEKILFNRDNCHSILIMFRLHKGNEDFLKYSSIKLFNQDKKLLLTKVKPFKEFQGKDNNSIFVLCRIFKNELIWNKESLKIEKIRKISEDEDKPPVVEEKKNKRSSVKPNKDSKDAEKVLVKESSKISLDEQELRDNIVNWKLEYFNKITVGQSNSEIIDFIKTANEFKNPEMKKRFFINFDKNKYNDYLDQQNQLLKKNQKSQPKKKTDIKEIKPNKLVQLKNCFEKKELHRVFSFIIGPLEVANTTDVSKLLKIIKDTISKRCVELNQYLPYQNGYEILLNGKEINNIKDIFKVSLPNELVISLIEKKEEVKEEE